MTVIWTVILIDGNLLIMPYEINSVFIKHLELIYFTDTVVVASAVPLVNHL